MTDTDTITEPETGTDTGQQDPPADPPAAVDDAPKVEMTQAELDALIAKRLGQERKQLQKEMDEAAARASMDEVDRLKAEKADAEKAAEAARIAASERAVKADLKVAAVFAKVDPEKVDRFIKVADFDPTDLLDDDGNPDADAIAKAVKKAAAEWPEFAVPTGANGRSAGDMSRNATASKPSTLEEAVAAQMAL